MCYSLTSQSSTYFRNLHSLKINGDRSISTSNLASLWFPSSPVIDRRRISSLFTVRFFRKLRFVVGNDAADLFRAPINRLCVRYSEARRTLEYLHDAAEKNTAEIDLRRNSSLYTPRCLISSRFGRGGNAAADLRRGNRLGVHCSGGNDAEAVTAAAAAGQPDFSEFITSERVKVVAMLALALALCNADRVVMSVAIVPLSLSRGWSKSFSGIVQSSFLWGYLVSPIAGGALVDRYGGKVVMAWGVALWSLATFLTPWAADTSLWALLASRAMVGVAEGVALPCMNNMVARWFPSTERSRAVGIAMAGFQLGNVVGLMLSPILMSQGGIYGPFVIFGLSGFLWLLVWLSATSSAPDMHPQITKSELEYIKQTPDKAKQRKATGVIPPFRRLLSKMPTWAVIVANSMHSWGFFVILSWMPIYFNLVYHVNLKQAAWFSAVPWSMMAFTGYIAGSWSDLLIRRGTTITLTRKIMQSIGFIGPGIALIGLTTAKHPLIASAWLSLAVGLKSFSHLGFLINLQEIAPEYSGVLHGMCLTAGTLAAIVGTIGAGFFVELLGSFQGFIMLTAILYLLSALFYNVYSTGERVDFDTTGA